MQYLWPRKARNGGKNEKNLFLFLLNLLLVGCSVNQDALVSSSSDPEPTINSTSVPNVDQKEQPFLDYPDTVFAYVCHQ